MPIKPFQREVLACLARHRSPDSYLAGGTVLNVAPDSPRFTDDLDIFHDVAASVASCALFDAEVLRQAGYTVAWQVQQPSFFRGLIARGDDGVKMEWVADSAFRFFPVESDAEVGWRLHFADAATNKILALAERRAIRDYVDVVHLHRTYLPLGALVWAAAAKDPGLTPDFILEQATRNTHYQESDLAGVALREPLTLRELKTCWLAAAAAAADWMRALPPEDYGCLYLDAVGRPFAPAPGTPELDGARRHFGSLGGAWPRIVDAS